MSDEFTWLAYLLAAVVLMYAVGSFWIFRVMGRHISMPLCASAVVCGLAFAAAPTVAGLVNG